MHNKLSSFLSDASNKPDDTFVTAYDFFDALGYLKSVKVHDDGTECSSSTVCGVLYVIP